MTGRRPSSLNHMKKIVRAAASLVGAVIIALWWCAAPVLAHPLGNFTINRYSRLTVQPASVNVIYVVDMAEIPTHSERQQMDADKDGVVSLVEEEAYRSTTAAALLAKLRIEVQGQRLPIELSASELEFPLGQANLPTLRLTLYGRASIPTSGVLSLDFTDSNYSDRLGWSEVVIASAAGVELLDSTAPATDMSDALRRYPEDLLMNPPTVNSASASFQVMAGAESSQMEARLGSVEQRAGGADPFAQLITLPIVGPLSVVAILGAAFLWGAAHALSPGHGKAIAAAYLVGARGTVRHAMFLGVTTTITHTFGVFALGLVTLVASKFILPERLFPWLSVISGVLVIVIGLSLARTRLFRSQSGQGHHHHHDHHHHHHGHEHDHHHHDHEHDHHHHDHSHMPPGADGQPVTWRNLLMLGVAGGLLPCPSALVLMLGAISVQRVGFGLLLIVLFSLGLASVLTAIGIALVYARHLINRVPESGPVLRFAPVASAAFITLAGVVITWQALLQTGLFSWT